MSKPVFRKASLDRLASPEQLDAMLRVTSPWGWLSLIAAGSLIAAALVWSISAEIPKKVYVQGVLLASGGISPIKVDTDGQIIDIRAEYDAKVHKGETIARMAQPALLTRLNQAQSELAATQRLAGEAEDSPQVIEAKRIVEELQKEYDRSSRVISPYSGRVIELKAVKGDLISAGTTIASLERTSDGANDLVAVTYVPAQESKLLIPGMDVQIALASVKKEQFGFMLGKVDKVAELPSTFQGREQSLGSEALAEALTGSQPTVEVQIDLIPDESTVSGFKWSTREGPPLTIQSGTMIDGSIIIETRHPIAYVLPIFQ